MRYSHTQEIVFARRVPVAQVAIVQVAMVVGLFLALQPFARADSVEPEELANRLFPTNSTSTYANGSSVALYGNILVVGDPVAGAAYVYENAGSPGKWDQVQTLRPDSPSAGFGAAVACDGTSIVVGSPNETAAYVFRGGGSSWTVDDRIWVWYQPSFGSSVAVNGDFVVVGSPHGYTISGAGYPLGYEADAGAAHLFYRGAPLDSGGMGGQRVWGPVAQKTVPEYSSDTDTRYNLFGGGVTLYNAAGNHFGTSVAISDQFLAVGAPDAGPGALPHLGIVSIYKIINNQGTYYWSYAFPLGDSQVQTTGDRYGYALAINGNQLVVGAPASEAAYVYSLKSVAPGEPGFQRISTLTAPDGLGAFGSAVAFDGVSIAVGAPAHPLPYPNIFGAVYVFDGSGSLQEEVLPPSCPTYSHFGVSVAEGAGLTVVGATNSPPNTDRSSVWLSEDTSDDLTVRWVAAGGGFFADLPNWSPQRVPATCDIVHLENPDQTSRAIDVSTLSFPIGGPYNVAELDVVSGIWGLNYFGGLPWPLSSSRHVQIRDGATLSLRNMSLRAPSILLGSGSTLVANNSQAYTGLLDIGSGASLIVSNNSLTVTNLQLKSAATFGWRNGGLNVEGHLKFLDRETINVLIDPSQSGSETPLFKVGDPYTFRAGGKLNLIPINSNLAAGQRFRLVQFKTDDKAVTDIFDYYRFKDYDPTIPQHDDLIWGLAFREDSISGAQFLEALVMKKPVLIATGKPLSPRGSAGLVLTTHGTYSYIEQPPNGGFGEIAADIQTFLFDKSVYDWDVVTYDWSEFSTSAADFTYNAATSAQVGIGLGESLVHWMDFEGFNYTKAHLISHSSGTWLINRMRPLLIADTQLTFCDAFTPPGSVDGFPFGDRFSAILGAGAGGNDFVEHYVDTGPLPPGTNDKLPNAVNFDVTGAVIASPPLSRPNFLSCVIGLIFDCIAKNMILAHQWPYKWYLETVRYANNTVPSFSGVSCAGFCLSPEFLEASANDPHFTYLPAYKGTLHNGVQIPIGQQDCQPPSLTASPQAYPPGFQNVTHAPVGTYNLVGQAISMLTGLGPLPIPVPLAGGPSDYQWAAITNYVVLPQTATTFTFDYQFTAPSNGVLLVIADGGSPAIFDQSNSGTNLLTSDAVPLYPELGAGPHQIVFFLESVSNQPVSVVLSNLKFSYDTRSIITDKRILTNGNVQLTLQGIPALHYSIERTWALGGPWTNIGVVLTSTNGLGVFTDTNSSSASMFYRADASGPSVSTAVTSQTNIVGQSVTLAAAAQGTPTLLYQWLKDGVTIGGATNSSLVLSSLATNDTGAYSVIVSNDHGVAETQIANLTVLLPPSILVQPLDWTPLIGQSVSLTVQAIGSDSLSYQWRKNGSKLTNLGNISGVTGPSLTLTNVQLSDQAGYDVIISNGGGSITSRVAQLTAMPLGESEASTGVTATATSELCFSPYNRCASNAVDGIYNSAVWESVGFNEGFGHDGAPAITFDLGQTYPLDRFMIWNGQEPGRSISRLNLQVSLDGVNFTSLGDTSLAMGGTPPQSETNYLLGGVVARFVRFAILENWGGAVFPTTNPYPANAMVMINEVEFGRRKTEQKPPAITFQPLDRIISPSETIQVSVLATGTDPLIYQWRKAGAPITDAGDLSGARTAALTLTNSQPLDSGIYDVVVTNYFGSVTSRLASVSMVPSATTFAVTGLTAMASSELAPYQRWATNTLNPSASVWESVGVDQGYGTDRDPWIMFDLLAVYSLADVAVSNGPEPIPAVKRMMIEVSSDGQAFVPLREVALANIASPQTNLLGVATRYIRFHILENWAGQVFPVVGTPKANAWVEINKVVFDAFPVPTGPPVVTIQPADRLQVSGTSAAFAVTAAGSDPLTYQWKKNGSRLLDGGNVTGAASPMLNLTNVQLGDTANYQEVVTNAFGSVTSIVARLVVIPATGVLLQNPQRASTNLSFHLLALPGTTWEVRRAPTLGGPWIAIGSISIGLSADALFVDSSSPSPASFYRAAATQAVAPSIMNQPKSVTNLVGGMVSFSVTANGTAPLSYRWRFGGTNLVAETNSLLSIPNLTLGQAGAYDVVVTNSSGSTTSTAAALVIVVPPQVTGQPDSQTRLVGATALLSVSATGTGPLGYRWRKTGLNLSDGGSIAGSLTPTLSISNAQLSHAGSYDVVITNSYASVTSQVATLTVSTNHLLSGLLAYFPFSGNALDASGNGRDGNIQGAVLTTNRLGQANEAYAFNGTGYIQVNNLDPDEYTNGFSYGLWVYPQSPGGWLYWYYTASWGATFIQWDGQLHFRIGTGSPATDHAVSGVSLSLTNWSHLVVTHGTTNDTLYLNGQSVGQWPSLPMQRNGSYLRIGQGYGTGCPGAIDDVVVYGRELSADEVNSLYNSGLP